MDVIQNDFGNWEICRKTTLVKKQTELKDVRIIEMKKTIVKLCA